jgi:Flp pilus assembly secretin CpaC
VTKQLQTLAFVFAFALASTALVTTQEKEKEKTPAPAAAIPSRVAPPAIPLKVQIVIARYQGEKKISSMPYNLSVITGRGANLRMGTKIPITMLMMSNVPKDAPAGGPVQYQDVGTNIDCTATALEDGRFSLHLTIEDSSVYPDEQSASKGNPSFRSFRASNAMVLKNGETGTFTTATEKVTGETVKVDVTLTVVK